ncbi:50S ribosomal protein L6 [bacterium]|nr:50S ribosomal protein L6 [bacterium]
MSRIGRIPISIPNGVDVTIEAGQIKVKGPKGELTQAFDKRLDVKVENGQVVVSRGDSEDRYLRGQHGLTRTLINNMIIGVTEGFKISLDIVGVGYRVSENKETKGITLALGYSHPIEIPAIPGIVFTPEVDNRAKINRLHISGIDKVKVGQVAADIRKLRAPEPYKGKGIKYVDEVIIRKAGKAGKTGK